ncbi:MAG: phosphoribosyltransferase [bacterium]|nr:phosphoribosyltransferase [bacterium]
MKSYIITEDLEFLMKRWSDESGFKIPNHQFFVSLQKNLQGYLGSIFSDLVLIGLDDLSSQMKKKISLFTDYLVVSIDQVYNNSDFHLESNRIADIDTMEIIGEAQRPGYPSLSEQISGLPNGQPVILIDDGCFSGDTLFRIFSLMKEKGLDVQKIIVGIIIDRADNRFVQEYPGIDLETVYEFSNVIDWVCERDFFIGVPLSGRTAGTKEGDIIIPCNPGISLPYCLPFGDPIKGASIPTNRTVEFSRFIINLSRKMWEEVERSSGRTVSCSDISRLPKGIDRSDEFVKTLVKARDSL